MTATRDRLVVATIELFRRQGYNGTSLKQITESSRATTGSLYHFFPHGKDQLTREVLIVSGSEYRQLFELIANGADSSGEAIEAFFEGAADTLRATDFIDPCPIGTVAREVASVNDDLRSATNSVFESWVDAARDRLVADGIDRVTAHDLAQTIVAAIEGGFVLARASRDESVLRRIGLQIRRLVEVNLAANCV